MIPRRKFTLSALLLYGLLLGSNSSASAEELVFGFVPLEEWEGAQQAHGSVSFEGVKAIEAAAAELRKRGSNLEKFRTVTVQETSGSFLVNFTDLRLQDLIHNDDRRPGNDHVVLVRLDKTTFAVLGSSL